MTGMVSDTDLARICLSLEGLDLLRDLLKGQGDDVDLDLLAVTLSEFGPEKTLLFLSAAANMLCEQGAIDAALKVSLKLQAGHALDDYAPLYLAQMKGVSHPRYEEQTIYMEEDLESFGELFALAADLTQGVPLITQSCSILCDAALAQAEILMEQDAGVDYGDTGESAPANTPDTPIIFSDNVVPFPGLYRKLQ